MHHSICTTLDGATSVYRNWSVASKQVFVITRDRRPLLHARVWLTVPNRVGYRRRSAARKPARPQNEAEKGTCIPTKARVRTSHGTQWHAAAQKKRCSEVARSCRRDATASVSSPPTKCNGAPSSAAYPDGSPFNTAAWSVDGRACFKPAIHSALVPARAPRPSATSAATSGLGMSIPPTTSRRQAVG